MEYLIEVVPAGYRDGLPLFRPIGVWVVDKKKVVTLFLPQYYERQIQAELVVKQMKADLLLERLQESGNIYTRDYRQIVTTDKYDNASACAEAVLRDIQLENSRLDLEAS